MSMLPPKKLKRLFKKHATIDKDGDKCLDKDSFKTFLEEYGFTEDDMQKSFDVIDVDGSQTISWKECKKILSKTDRSKKDRQRELKQALRIVMKDKKELDEKLLLHILTVGQNPIPQTVAEEEIRKLFQQYDANSDQKLTKHELSAFLVGKRDKGRKRKERKKKDTHRDGRPRTSDTSDSSTSSSCDSSDDEYIALDLDSVAPTPLPGATDEVPAPSQGEQEGTTTQVQNETQGDAGQTSGEAETTEQTQSVDPPKTEGGETAPPAEQSQGEGQATEPQGEGQTIEQTDGETA